MMLLEIVDCSSEGCYIDSLPSLFISILFAILFLQSGLDKVFNYKSELNWTKEHFSKSILANGVSFMFVMLIILELFTGVLSLAAPLLLWFTGDYTALLLASEFACITIISLFFGQRMAKDYAGAASLTGYFIIAALGIYINL